MKSTLISLPCSLILSVFVVRVTVMTLGMTVPLELLTAAVLLCTVLLFKRSLLELGLIVALTGMAQLNVAGAAVITVNPDIMLALLLTAIVLPTTLRTMGMEVEFGRSY